MVFDVPREIGSTGADRANAGQWWRSLIFTYLIPQRVTYHLGRGHAAFPSPLPNTLEQSLVRLKDHSFHIGIMISVGRSRGA